MIIILGYNNTESEILNEILDNQAVEYKYSLLENQITNAEKIILPHPLNLNAAYRRMNLMNLFSVLRMVKMPIFGINDGFSLMCVQLVDRYKKGLGFFDINKYCGDERSVCEAKEIGSISINRDSKLLRSQFNNSKVFYNSQCQPESSDSSKVNIVSEEKEYSLILEKGNYFGAAICGTKNHSIIYEVVSNFIKL